MNIQKPFKRLNPEIGPIYDETSLSPSKKYSYPQNSPKNKNNKRDPTVWNTTGKMDKNKYQTQLDDLETNDLINERQAVRTAEKIKKEKIAKKQSEHLIWKNNVIFKKIETNDNNVIKNYNNEQENYLGLLEKFSNSKSSSIRESSVNFNDSQQKHSHNPHT